MTNKHLSLAEQREQIRAQLHAQREVIAMKLTRAEVQDRSYPRSMVMRFLTQRPVAAITAEVATLLLGARLIRSFNSVKTLVQVFKSLRSGKNIMAA